MPFPLRLAIVLLLPLLLAGGAATARDSVVIYRCTDAAGALTVQNDVPCPPGTQQDRRVLEHIPPPTPSPAAVPVTALPAAVVAVPSSTPPPDVAASNAGTGADAAAGRLPPPTLFECRTFDERTYVSEHSDPPTRCVPLQTVGVGGAPDVAAGRACEMVTDTCEPVAAEALCESWTRRLREAETALRFGRFESREVAQAEVARAGQIVGGNCGL